MFDVTPERLRRWDTWQHASAVTMRNDHLAHLAGLSMLGTTLAALAFAIWR